MIYINPVVCCTQFYCKPVEEEAKGYSKVLEDRLKGFFWFPSSPKPTVRDLGNVGIQYNQQNPQFLDH